MDRIPVLVVGAGPTGLMLGAELARRGIECRLVDAALEPSAASKAVGIWARTLELLEPLGLTEAFLAEGLQISGGNFYSEGRHLARVGFERIESRYRFGFTVPQFRTEALLARRAAELGVKIERGTTLSALVEEPHGVVATLSTTGGNEKVLASWVVGCDGAHSTVRGLCSVSFRGSRLPENLLLGDVLVDGAPSADEGHFFLSRDGLVVFVPLPEGRWRVTADAPALDLDAGFEDLCHLVRERLGPRIALRAPGWISAFRIHRRLAATFRSGRCILAGDAAHIHSPAGGQGMNMGMADAVDVASTLESVLGGETDSCLDHYSRRRRREARRVLLATTVATRVGLSRSGVVRSARNELLRLAGSYGFLDRHLAPRLAGSP